MRRLWYRTFRSYFKSKYGQLVDNKAIGKDLQESYWKVCEVLFKVVLDGWLRYFLGP